ncbi:uncharacterized protein LOC113280367 [Papaver somniferum]|uniref:uncharacterized protein LOC113280367 n=1 Tax=Papaver somniferum TaxID=3469 RepID=UPI000E6FCED1|nr:uncharacterized protein LOC113280367 [Papaver somniferum]
MGYLQLTYFFADDMFLFCNGDRRNVRRIMQTLAEYQISSGQTVSGVKSKCFVGGTTQFKKEAIAGDCNMQLESFPDKYLGVMLFSGRVKSTHIWGDPRSRKLVTLKWEKVCVPFKEGGMGIRSLEVINKALLMKLIWKIQQGNDEWVLFFHAKFKMKNGEWITYHKQSSIWTGMKWVMSEVKIHSRWIICDGEDISVWNDAWIKEKALSNLFPENDYIQLHKNQKISSLIINNEWNIPSEMLNFFGIQELPVIDGRKVILILEWFNIWQILCCFYSSVHKSSTLWSWICNVFKFSNPTSFQDVLGMANYKISVIKELWIAAAFIILR